VGGACGIRGIGQESVQGFGGKAQRKKSSQRSRRKWEDRIKMHLTHTGWEGVEWIHLAQNRDWWQVLVNTVMNLQVLAPQRQLVS
jgi:sarcosine oxidase delta subunit